MHTGYAVNIPNHHNHQHHCSNDVTMTRAWAHSCVHSVQAVAAARCSALFHWSYVFGRTSLEPLWKVCHIGYEGQSVEMYMAAHGICLEKRLPLAVSSGFPTTPAACANSHATQSPESLMQPFDTAALRRKLLQTYDCQAAGAAKPAQQQHSPANNIQTEPAARASAKGTCHQVQKHPQRSGHGDDQGNKEAMSEDDNVTDGHPQAQVVFTS